MKKDLPSSNSFGDRLNEFWRVISRRLFCALIAFAGLAVFLFGSARPLFARSSVMPTLRGEYVVYRDYTRGEEAYIGALYYGGAKYGLFAFYPARNARLCINVVVNSDGVPRVAASYSSFSSDLESAVLKYLLELFSQLLLYADNYNESAAAFYETSSRLSVFRETVVVCSEYYIPIFAVRRVADPFDETLFEAIYVGGLDSGFNSNEASDFYNFTPARFYDVDNINRINVRPNASAKTLTRFGVSIVLDDQWVSAGGQLFFLKTGDSYSAVLDVAEIDGRGAKLRCLRDFVRLLTRSSNRIAYDARQTQVAQKNGELIITNLALDYDDKIINRVFSIVFDAGGGSFVAITMSVIDSVYQANRAYFNSIIYNRIRRL